MRKKRFFKIIFLPAYRETICIKVLDIFIGVHDDGDKNRQDKVDKEGDECEEEWN